jgi:hypothetical protein
MIKKDGLTFTRSNKGVYDLFNESLKILEYSIMLVEFFEVKEFNKVIAIQLRKLLCDTHRGEDISLIRKINSCPKLYPVTNNFEKLSDDGSAFINPSNLFDYSAPRIELNHWLNQVIYKIKLSKKLNNITIKNFIKHSANKSGGAHVDDILPEEAFLVDVYHDRVLCAIAKCLLKSLGRDLEKQHYENFMYLFQKIKQKSSL